MPNKEERQTNAPRRGPGGMHMRFEKPKDFKKSIGKLMHYLKPFNLAIFISLLFAGFGTVFNILGPKLLGDITSEIQLNVMAGVSINLDKIAMIAIWLVILYLLSTVFMIIQAFIMTNITQKISKELRSNISQKINKLPLKYFDTKSYGDVLSRVTNDVDTIGQTLNQSLSQFVSSITTIIGILVMMIIISPLMTLIAIVTIPLSAFLMGMLIKFSQKYFKQQQKSLGELNGHIEEIYSGHTIVKVFNNSAQAKVEFTRVNQALSESGWKSQFYSGLMYPIMNFIGNLSYVAVSVVGGVLATTGRLLIGDIQSFIQYIRRFNQPLAQVAQMAQVLQSTAAAAERVFEFLDEEELADESHKTHKLNTIKGDVEFRHVKFGYTEDKIIIKDFNAKALRGQKIAIVGPTGAGKTTLVNLLMRFYELNEGDILIDGRSTKDLTRENVHALFGMVLQDTWLFQGTIYENLTYGKKNVTLEEVKKACRMANIDHFIESLPNGYDMILEENSNISQGQRQLLTIARAMIEDAPMMILDEATSSVDTRTEVLIQDAMDKLMKNRTTFVIAHRLSTIKNADLILVMNEGDIIETGNHEELLAKKGFYSELYNSQFETISA